MAEITYKLIDEGWGGGVTCAGDDCKQQLDNGMPYTERLLSFSGDTPVVEIVCVYCGFKTGSDDNFESVRKANGE